MCKNDNELKGTQNRRKASIMAQYFQGQVCRIEQLYTTARGVIKLFPLKINSEIAAVCNISSICYMSVIFVISIIC